MRKLFIAVIGVSLLAAFFLRSFWAPSRPEAIDSPASQPVPVAPASGPSTTKSALPAASPEASVSPALSEESRAAVRECLGQEVSDWASLARAIEGQATGPRALQWRVLRTEEAGREIRLRVFRETLGSGRDVLAVKVYSVDEAGLPDLLPEKPGQRENGARWLNEYLKGKPIQTDARLEEVTLPDGRALLLESDGNELVEAQFTGTGKSLACSRKQDDPRCACL